MYTNIILVTSIFIIVMLIMIICIMAYKYYLLIEQIRRYEADQVRRYIAHKIKNNS